MAIRALFISPFELHYVCVGVIFFVNDFGYHHFITRNSPYQQIKDENGYFVLLGYH